MNKVSECRRAVRGRRRRRCPGRGERRLRQAPVDYSVSTSAARPPGLPGGFKHLVVIYEENHSFDNLYGGWGSVDGQRVNGRPRATAAHTTQVGQDGTKLSCLPQNDVNLASPPQPADCTDTAHKVVSHFTNKPFAIDRFIKPTDTTCPAPGVFAPNGVAKGSPGAAPGGCTRDIVHRFYQEQYQLNGGRQNRYTDRLGRGRPDPGLLQDPRLPIYKYLHRKGAPEVRRGRPVLPGGVRRLVPQPPVAHRGPHPARHQPRGRRCGELGARQQRHGHEVPALHADGAGHGRRS